MSASTIIGILSALLIGAACTFASVTGAPAWLAGYETEVFLKVAAVLGLVVFAERLWRSTSAA
jgi:hypothetical protein